MLYTDTGPVVEDLKTGTRRTMAVPRTFEWQGAFVQPGGNELVLLSTGQGQNGTNLLELYGDKPSALWSTSTTVDFLKVSPDGRFIVGDRSTTKEGVLVLDATTGTILTTVPTPVGASTCDPLNWWNDGEVVISCLLGSRTELWRYALDTGSMSRISRGLSVLGAYSTSRGVVVPRLLPTCDPQPVGVLNSDGTAVTPLAKVPEPLLGASLEAVVGTTAYLQSMNCGTAVSLELGSSLATYDLVSGRTTVIVAGVRNRGGIQSMLVLR
jgi:hypothetical protein